MRVSFSTKERDEAAGSAAVHYRPAESENAGQREHHDDS
jgi:hypothetical protein